VLPKVETMTPHPKSPYALQKLVGEYYGNIFSSVYGLETVSLRYFNVYGPRQDPSSPYSGVLSRFMRAVLERSAPTIFGDPEPWMAELYEALRLNGRGDHGAAGVLRTRAFDNAPATPGRVNGQDCAWIADADSRLGPMLEVIINGRYFWLPFMRLSRLAIEPPSDLRDQVWMPVRLTFANGGETVALVPTRYVGSELSLDPLIRLARKTEWVEIAPETYQGRGQRTLATDEGEFPLMDVRTIELEAAAPPARDADG